MKRFFLILVLLFANMASGQIVVTEGPVARPLPQVIQNMNDKEYAAWAIWHNLVTSRKATESTGPSRYLHGKAIDTYGHSRGRTIANSNSYSNSYSQRSKATGSSSQSSSRHGYTSIGNNRNSSSHTRSYQYRYLNPDYTGPGVATYYNPFVRQKGGIGYPDYENIYLPTPKGPRSIADLMLTPKKEKPKKNGGITSEDAIKLIEKYGSTWYDHVDEIGL